MSDFFIDRPVFAWVIALVIMLAGALSIHRLPVEQYPNIAPPTVSINASYPGASAEAIENSVTQVIEQRLTGIDKLRFFSSTSDSAGNVSINVTLEPEANPDIAQVQVQNKVQTAMPLLPQDVQNNGVTVAKSNDALLMVAAFYSEDGSISQQELGDVLGSKVVDSIARVDGVGNVRVLGQPHAIRIWLNPHKLLSYGLTAMDVRAAVDIQNADVSAGQLGGMPATPEQEINATITAQSLLHTPEEFEQIILRANPDGSQVRLHDVARVEMGSQNYENIARYKRMPAAGMPINLASGANALETAAQVRKRIDELLPVLPPGVKVAYPYDATPFVKLSINGVVETLIEAALLVFAVIFLFLQNVRATLIPAIAVPVVLLGTFAVLSAFGFTINVLTLFALVLAIGLLVDDAIVVVENVERVMEEEGLSPREATKKSMHQITGALIGIALVLSAVFVPMAFFTGSAGAIYRQFSITIVSAMGLSVLVALVLSPPLCATLLKSKHGHAPTHPFFLRFNAFFEGARNRFLGQSSEMARRMGRYFLIYGVLVGGLMWLFVSLPTSFIPGEDQGSMRVIINAPPGATAARTLESVKEVENYFLEKEQENVEHLFTVVGFSFSGRAQNTAVGFIGLTDWSKRGRSDQHVTEIAARATRALSSLKNALVFTVVPPPIRELGNASGFDFQLLDRGGLGRKALIDARNQLLTSARANPLITGVRPGGLEDAPQFRLDIDHEKASALGVPIADINRTLQTAWAPTYVNDFIDEGRLKRVYLQADAPYRMMPENLRDWYVRANNGQMVSFANFSTGRWTNEATRLERFNGTSAVNIQGSAAKGISSGTAMMEMEKAMEKLPTGFAQAWSGISYEERRAGAQAAPLYALSILFVFLCLAALYESWSVPFAVLMILPLGILGAVLGAKLTGLANDVYFQVGLLTTVGLTAKNAILIIEFAKELVAQGYTLYDAAMTAARMRFRPIIMTSMAFMLGVLPLALASGAGSAAQNAIGICVIGGMMAATFLAIFFVPMFFMWVLERFSSKAGAS